MSIVIFSDKNAYTKALDEAKSKRKVFNELLKEAKKYIDLDGTDRKLMKEFKEHPYKFFKQKFLDKYKDKNTLGLGFDKLALVLEVNTTNISLLSDKYLKMDFDEDPKEHDFVQLAKTPEQMERYAVAKKACDALMDLKRLTPFMNLSGLMSAAGGTVQIDYSSFILIPNPYWVLNGTT